MEVIEEKPFLFLNSRNQKLWGVLSLSKGKGKYPGIVICHGFAGTKSQRKFVELARYFAKRKIAVFRFDFSGCGDSEGDFEKMTIGGQAQDLKKAFEAFAKLKRIDKDRVGILGYSLGALISVLFETKYKQAKALILTAPVLNQKDLIKRWYSQYQIRKWKREKYLDKERFRIGVQYLKETEDYTKKASEIKIPTLILQGSRDKDVPLKYTKEFFKEVSGKKELKLVRGADHNFESCFAKKELIKNSLNWFKKYL